MKVLKTFFITRTGKKYFKGLEYNETPLQEWVDAGLIESEIEKKEEKKEVETKELKVTRKTKGKK